MGTPGAAGTVPKSCLMVLASFASGHVRLPLAAETLQHNLEPCFGIVKCYSEIFRLNSMYFVLRGAELVMQSVAYQNLQGYKMCPALDLHVHVHFVQPLYYLTQSLYSILPEYRGGIRKH